MSEKLTAEELAYWKHQYDAHSHLGSTFVFGVPKRCLDKFIAAAEEAERLRAAINYAAGSLEQSPTGEIPPIVIFDVIEHLREAMK